MKGAGSLIAYGFIDASVTTITVANFVALPLFDPSGNSIPSGVLPYFCRKVQFATNVSKNFLLGLKSNTGPGGYEYLAVGQQDALDVVAPQQAYGIKSFDADLTTGKFAIYFYS